MSSSLRKIKIRKNPKSVKKILQDERRRTRLILLVGGFFLLIVGSVLSTPAGGNNERKEEKTESAESVTTFAQEPVKIDENLLRVDTSKKVTKSPPTRLVIPDLSIDVQVREAKVIKGYWEVFADSAGFGLGSSYPQDIGNQVIFAHARAGLFLPLKQAKIGQKIYVFTKDSWYGYFVKDIKEVLPTQVEVIAPTKESILTLYTCSGFADKKRLIITAGKV
ncbi:sortase [Candidatus Gottesmanbacteria bacterium]|nr:sortase [Candidatus Gottesmanbacteria bacterium]